VRQSYFYGREFLNGADLNAEALSWARHIPDMPPITGRIPGDNLTRRTAETSARKYELRTFEPRTLRVQVPAPVSTRLIAPALPRFLYQRPGLRMQLSEVDGTEKGLPHDADAAVCTRPAQDPMLVVQHVATLRLVTCASPDFIQCHGLPQTPADLAPRHCIGVLQPGTTAARAWIFSNARETWSFVPAARMTFHSTECAIAAAVRGGGYARVLSIEADDKMTSGLLQSVLEEWDEEWPVSIVYARDLPLGDDVAAFSAFVTGLLPSRRSELPALSPTGSG
jgi:DNA-binding transcriptional LysR family regulator